MDGSGRMKRKYELIIEDIEELVLLNKLKQGERLPSIRAMAIKHKCNKSTVIRAYKELEINHKAYAIPKSGYYLVEKYNLNEDESHTIDFSEVMPDSKLLPYKEFNHCVNKAVELYSSSLFTYGDTQGLESLRSILVNHFSQYQVFTSQNRIFITSGSQQALSILAKMPFPNGKKSILVEQPTYSLIRGLAELNGNKLIGIDRDYDGIDFNRLEEILRGEDVKFFYTIPRLHNPLGTSYSEKEKRKIVELAKKYNVYIVEDDYLADIEMIKKRLPAFYYDTSKKVIYLKSFSKAFMPGIRIGAVVLHEELREEFLKHKRYYDLNTSVLAQGALEIFINSGMYNNHIKKVQVQYRKKMNYLRDYLRSLDTSKVEFLIPETGFFVWIKLLEKINIDTLVKRLRDKNVYITPSNEFFIESNLNENSLRICISKLTQDEIRRGIAILFEEINRL